MLGCPDDQICKTEAEAYDALVEYAQPLSVSEPRSGKGWILALDGAKWIPTKLHLNVTIYGTSLSIGPTEPGMSGSPILDDRGRAVGVVAMGGETVGRDGQRRAEQEAGPQPTLTRNLPGWLLSQVFK